MASLYTDVINQASIFSPNYFPARRLHLQFDGGCSVPLFCCLSGSPKVEHTGLNYNFIITLSICALFNAFVHLCDDSGPLRVCAVSELFHLENYVFLKVPRAVRIL